MDKIKYAEFLLGLAIRDTLVATVVLSKPEDFTLLIYIMDRSKFNLELLVCVGDAYNLFLNEIIASPTTLAIH
jgi:hypothetical protein